MREFVVAALSFPAALFTFLLLVVVGYWLFVAFGLSDVDALDGVDGAGAETLDGLGLGGVPISVALSLVISLSWFGCLVGTVLLSGSGFPGVAVAALSVLTLVVAVLVALVLTRLVVVPLRGLFDDRLAPTRSDFVGLLCVVRTGRVDLGFGQAEVTAADGSSAIVQVRQAGTEPLRAGSTAVIHDYDPEGEFFWVAPVDLDFPIN
ncbi:hypothetical protein [Actinokineospora spheciospongiae]|uniref:hypothetical protein n=1 Tax=Actinokineospora spheciospongiae TaxID=909613 RepID=UPI000D7169C0|nr:hypothetical protein [Actinokineospora spheciospongiae]PWW64042.1 hypothetical protein DFQ13_1037 [Actinokineospora spheciospongiae]